MKIFKFSAIPIILLFLLFLGNCKNPENDSNSPASMYGRFLLRLGLTQTLANTSYNVTALPSQVTVSIPRSIRKSTTTLSSVLEPRIMRQTTETQLAKAKGYQNLIDIVDKMYGLLGQTKLELILLNEVLQEAKNSPNTCFTGGTKSLKITQEMINSIKQSFMDYGLTSAQAETELLKQQESGKLPKLGESIPSPAVLYRSISETDTDTRLKKDYELGYRHIVQYYTSDKPSNTVTCPASDSGYNKVMKYDAAFQNIFYSVKADLEVPGLTIGIVASIALSKATSTDANSRDTMIFNMVTREKRGSKYTTTIDKNTITKCKQDANDSCIKIDSDTIQKDPSITSRDYDLKISVNGKINDSGGFILTEIHDVIFGDKVVDASGTTTTKVQKRYIKELFDSSGNLLGLEEGTDGRTFKPVEGFAKIDMTGGNVLDIFGEKFDGFGMGSAGGRVFIGFSTGPEGIGLNNVESDQFIIYQALSTTDAPSGYNDPSIVGEGEYLNPCSGLDSASCSAKVNLNCKYTNNVCTKSKVTGGDIYIDYWGTKDVIPRLALYRRSMTSTGAVQYTRVTGTNVFKVLEADPYSSPTSQFYDPYLDPNFNPDNICYINPAACFSGGTFNPESAVDCTINPNDPMCTYDPTNDACFGLAPATCDNNTGRVAKCTYDPYMGSCMNVFGMCEPHLNSNSCTSAGCTWDSSFYFCSPAGQTINCAAQTTEYSCYAYPKCMWDQTALTCSENTVGFGVDQVAIATCPGLDQVSCDNEIYCTFGTQCNVACDFHYDQQACTGSPAGCAWDPTNYYCYSSGGGGTGTYTSCADIPNGPDCNASTFGCTWDPALFTCSISGGGGTGCASYPDFASCSADPTCTWNSGTSICEISGGGGTICSNNTTQISCQTDSLSSDATFGCAWVGTSCRPGYDPTGVSGCSNHTAETACAEEPACYWDGSTCLEATSCIDIDTFHSGSLKSVSCQAANGYLGCIWDTGTSTCGP